MQNQREKKYKGQLNDLKLSENEPAQNKEKFNMCCHISKTNLMRLIIDSST